MSLFRSADSCVAPFTSEWLLFGYKFVVCFASDFTLYVLVTNLGRALDAHLEVEVDFTFLLAHPVQ